MNGFTSTPVEGCQIWVPDPDQSTAHALLLTTLATTVGGNFLSPDSTLNQPQFGNLGEFLTLYVGDSCAGLPSTYRCHPVNGREPLKRVSDSGVDLLWFHFDADPQDDLIVLQEVKSTRQADLRHADGLIDDYQKLFSTDPAVILSSRIGSLKLLLRVTLRKPELVARCDRFVGTEPTECRDLRLMPTLVFDTSVAMHGAAARKLSIVRTTICGDGWLDTQVQPWGICLDELEAEFEALAKGS